MGKTADLLPGTLDMLILKAVSLKPPARQAHPQPGRVAGAGQRRSCSPPGPDTRDP